MSKELKPCPFCGGEAVFHYIKDNRYHCWVECENGDADVCMFSNDELAIKHWNTRPAEDALKKVIAEIAATLATGAEISEDDIFTMCKDAIGEKAILDRYNEKLRERVGDLENDTNR